MLKSFFSFKTKYRHYLAHRKELFVIKNQGFAVTSKKEFLPIFYFQINKDYCRTILNQIFAHIIHTILNPV